MTIVTSVKLSSISIFKKVENEKSIKKREGWKKGKPEIREILGIPLHFKIGAILNAVEFVVCFVISPHLFSHWSMR